jgi:hypothetical protein
MVSIYTYCDNDDNDDDQANDYAVIPHNNYQAFIPYNIDCHLID